MKKIFFLLLTLASFCAYAGDDISVCKSASEVAGYIMKARQDNLPMYENLELVEQIFADDEKALRAAKNLVLMAYENPQFMLEENKIKAIVDFENKIMLICMKEKMKR